MVDWLSDQFLNSKDFFQSWHGHDISKGGRYKIIREEKKGAVDTNLIIKNIAYNDNFARSYHFDYLFEDG